MEMMTLASGSDGNCTYISSGNTSILIDAGIACSNIEKRLEAIGKKVSDIDAIFVTHEHSDHIKGISLISRRYQTPVYATSGTIKGMRTKLRKEKVEWDVFNPVEIDSVTKINDLFIRTCEISHDTIEPSCYIVEDGRRKVSVVTDLGKYDEYLTNAIRESDIMLIEANHDENMLMVGPYPYDLKKRILGPKGHLSNENAGKLIRSVLNDHIKAIVLGHLSKENNFPDLAYEAVKYELRDNPFARDVREFNMTVAKRGEAGSLITI